VTALAIGIGNRSRRDDAAGLAVAERLRAQAPSDLAVEVWERPPVELIDRWADADRVVVIDAVRSTARPGTVHRFDATAAPLPAATFRCSTHGAGLADAIELGRALDRLPRRLIVYGIEARDDGFGEALSSEVQRAVASVTARVVAEIAPPDR